VDDDPGAVDPGTDDPEDDEPEDGVSGKAVDGDVLVEGVVVVLDAACATAAPPATRTPETASAAIVFWTGFMLAYLPSVHRGLSRDR